MWSLESRRDPVHQAALAFFLLAGLTVAGGALTHDGHAGRCVYAALLSLVGAFVWRRSLTALAIGTAFLTLLFVLGFRHTMTSGARLSTMVVVVLVEGSLLFVMLRGLVAKQSSR